MAFTQLGKDTFMTNDNAAPLDVVVLVALLAKNRLPPAGIVWLKGRLRGEETIDFSLEKHPEVCFVRRE